MILDSYIINDQLVNSKTYNWFSEYISQTSISVSQNWDNDKVETRNHTETLPMCLFGNNEYPAGSVGTEAFPESLYLTCYMSNILSTQFEHSILTQFEHSNWALNLSTQFERSKL